MAELAVDRVPCECGCGAGPGEHCRQVIGVDDEGHVIRDGRRVCWCGCGERLPVTATRRQRHVNERHRKRANRVKVRAAAQAAHLPSSLSLKSIAATGTTRERPEDAPTRRRAARRGPRPGDTAYFPPGAADAALKALNDLPDSPALTRAREALAAAIDRRKSRTAKRR